MVPPLAVAFILRLIPAQTGHSRSPRLQQILGLPLPRRPTEPNWRPCLILAVPTMASAFIPRSIPAQTGHLTAVETDLVRAQRQLEPQVFWKVLGEPVSSWSTWGAGTLWWRAKQEPFMTISSL